MSHHPSNPHTHHDTRIDQILDALGTTEPPTGLAQRIANRIANAAEARPTTTSYFAVILNAVKDPCISFAEVRLYAFAATALTLLLIISTITILHHRTPPTITQSKPIPNQPYAPTQPPTLAQASSPPNTRLSQASRLGNTQVPQGFSLGFHTANQRAGVLTPAPSQQDSDTIALAETLAPSHPAPPMPLTQQELLLFRATRQGQPIELAELDLAREPALRAAQARDKVGLQQFARSLLSQLVTSESLDSTPQSDSHDDAQPAPAPESPTTSTNEPPTNGASPQ